MNEGKLCPNCKNDIGVFAILKAGSPSRIKCPFCKTQLKYSPFPAGLLLIFLTVYFCLCILVFMFANEYEMTEQCWRWGLNASVLLVIPLGLMPGGIVAWYLRNKYSLVRA